MNSGDSTAVPPPKMALKWKQRLTYGNCHRYGVVCDGDGDILIGLARLLTVRDGLTA